MDIQFIDNMVIKFDSTHAIIRMLLYLKLSEKNIRLTDKDLDILCLFALDDNIKRIADVSIERSYKTSIRSVENTISSLVKKKLLINKGTGVRALSTELLPTLNSNIIAVNCKIHNVKV